MSTAPVTYSFKDSSGGFSHPLAGFFPFSGEIGLTQFTVAMHQERTEHDVAADGTIMVSYKAGDNGSLIMEMQQTSELHAFLLGWYNAIKILADQGNVTNWATATVTVINLVDKSTHVFTGVSPTKIPDKVYAASGGRISWNLMAADVQNLTLGASA